MKAQPIIPALFEGEGRRGEENDKHFSQLTKQYYFTAKIMLKYYSGESL